MTLDQERLIEVRVTEMKRLAATTTIAVRKFQRELAEAAKRSPGSAEVKKELGELFELGNKLPM